MKAKANGKCHVYFFAWAVKTRSTVSVIYFKFSIGPRVGVGAGVGADRKPGVGVGTAPPRLRTPGLHYSHLIESFRSPPSASRSALWFGS